MFCCGVCKVMFTGNYPESVSTTQCGHLFHSNCILLCLDSSSKCPFCSLNVEKNQLIKINFLIDSNWKDIAASLKNTTNASVINLDETMNISSNSAQFTESLDKSISELKIGQIDEDSVIDLTSDVSSISRNFSIDNQEQNPRNTNVKVLLTTSLSGFLLSKIMGDFLFILNAIIPNSTIQKRLMISESNLISAAINENFTHVLVIIMRNNFPHELYFLNLLKNVKLAALTRSFNCCAFDDYIMDRNHTPRLSVIKPERLNKSQEFIYNYFSEIFPIPEQKRNISCSIDDISVMTCSDDPQIKFNYKAASLSFTIIPHKPDYHESVFNSFRSIF